MSCNHESMTKSAGVLHDSRSASRAICSAISLGMALGALALISPGAANSADSTMKTKAAQGGVARWAEMDASACGFLGKRYPAVDGDCYYPVDMKLKPGRHEIALYDTQDRQHLATLDVEAVEFPEIEIELPDDTYIELSEESRERHAEERARILDVFRQASGEPQFSLPLSKPVDPLPGSEDDFGSRRVFNGTRKSQHSGRDAPVADGTPVRAVAGGTVGLAEEQFFTGNAVYIDHGGGLVSMFFHLGELRVASGDKVSAGDVVGTVGSTGRSTGPHMHIGLRWQNQRIDPYPLFEPPAELPEVADDLASADEKIDAAQSAEPPETGPESK